VDRFTHLAIDTSVLIGNGWPKASLDLRNVVAACQQLGIPLLIPEIVLAETDAEVARKTDEAIEAARHALSRAAGRLSGDLNAKVEWPDEKTRTAAYTDAIARLADDWRWTVVPMPKVSLAEAVIQSIRHEPPFPAEDKGFRDSLIVWSLLDHLKKGDILVMIGADKAFADARMIEPAKNRGIELHVFASPQAAWDVIEKLVRRRTAGEIFAAWEARSQRIVAALEQDRAGLEGFVRDNLRIPERPYGVEGRIETVHDVQVVGIEHALLRLFSDNLADASAELKLRVTVTISRYTPSLPRAMRVGETVDDVSPNFAGHERILTELDAFASITLHVTWPEDDQQLPTVKYIAAEFGTPQERLLRGVALRKVLTEQM
jgi:hypothetical protein